MVTLRTQKVIMACVAILISLGCFCDGARAEVESKEIVQQKDNGKGLIAIINGNFHGIDDEKMKKYGITSYNASSENPNDPVNEKMYVDSDKSKEETYNEHGTNVTDRLFRELQKQGISYENKNLPETLLIKTAGKDNPKLKDSYIAKGIREAANRGADVINISAGSISEPSAAIEDALKYAREKGSVVIAGSGNEGRKDPRMSYPATSEHTIAVGAHDEAGHPTAYTSGVGDAHLDVTAKPIGDGTSYAAPVVAADVYAMKKIGDPAKYDKNGDGKLDFDEVRTGLNQEAGKRFDDVNSITYDRQKILAERYGHVPREPEKLFTEKNFKTLSYDPEKPERYIEAAYINTGRYNEYVGALEEWKTKNSGNGEYCYISHAYQTCGFETKEVCEAFLPQDVGSCGKIGDTVDTKDGQQMIAAVPLLPGGNTGSGTGISGSGSNINKPVSNPQTGSGGGGGASNNTSSIGAGGNTAPTASTGGLVQCGKAGQPSCTICDLIDGIHGVIQFLVKLVTVTGITIITIAGVMYIISAGNSSMTSLAKAAVTNVLIGITVILVAFISITFIINTIFQNEGASLKVKENGLSGFGSNLWSFDCEAEPSGVQQNATNTTP